MSTTKFTSALTAMICAAALLPIACGRNTDTEKPRSAELQPAPVQAPAPAQPEAVPTPAAPPPAAELPAERSVEAHEQVTAAEREDLTARQRELDRREADLARRERAAAHRQASAKRPAPLPAEPRETAPAPEPETAAPAPEPEEPRAEQPLPEPEPRPEPATVESGTVLRVELLETLSSESSRPGETFRARVDRDIEQDGRVVIPAGSEVVGEVTEAVPLKKVGGQAKLAVRFTDLVLPSGSSVPIEASFVGQGRSETGRDAATIGGSAAGGAVLGRVLSKGNRSKGAVIGAIIGAVVGTAVASRTPGEEVTLGKGDVVDIKLDRPVEVRVRR